MHGKLLRIICSLHLTFPYISLLSISQLEQKSADEAQTVRKPVLTSEPAGVLGWEVLEAEGPVTGTETESLLSTKKEESSGIVKAIVGVFHKG